ncbi:hypothetical protein VAR608DRAFT_4553 [Variovorax sp. HW608]|uniref:hypothetical protein n=1 Tax=Variovorax sp. HW608 TaxID=1034889 RepID=UPI00081F9199|nr:hypothetical protein [Variovorax sp. HW608]SCK46398.1 hypothetical protein VAR608DRAFT_4553 [Variovorax sp. HW608]
MSKGGTQRSYVLKFDADKKRLIAILEGPGPAKPKDDKDVKSKDDKLVRSIEASAREAFNAANDVRSEANAGQAARDQARRAASASEAGKAASKAEGHAQAAFDRSNVAAEKASKVIDDVATIFDATMRQTAGAIVARALENAATAIQDSERADLTAKGASEIAASTKAWNTQTQ